MKLVDILARELKTWPEGVQCLTQSSVDREIYDALDGQPGSSVESLNPRFDTIDSHTEAEYPIVTRAQWQSKVDALDIHKFDSGNAKWTEKGLPPIGTVCEAMVDPGVWSEVQVLAHGIEDEDVVAILQAGSRIITKTFMGVRLIRTPEQIAAEEREKDIEAMNTLVGDIDEIPTWTDALSKLYDAGYRKVEVKP